ncbi:hypothetical protein D1872_199540 [compost metagenome]
MICHLHLSQQRFQLSYLKATPLYNKRIIAVWLNQAHKQTDIEISYAGVKPHIISSVLVCIAKITISLRVISRLELKEIIVPFQIPMLA